MESQPSFTSLLPWIWAIEILASSKHVDVSLLLDLVETVPRLSADMGRNAREMVFLRVLESIYDQNTHAKPVLSALSPKIGFDKSENCETVLGRILDESSSPNLKADGEEMLNWDIRPFIAHKRSCLASCSLQKLKDSILAGHHPSLVSLRERSGLQVPSGNGKDGCASSKRVVMCSDTDVCHGERSEIVNISSSVVSGEEVNSSGDSDCSPDDDMSEEEDISGDADWYNDELPRPRRKKHLWTTVEEEKLREAMLAICRPDDKVISWKKILDFGAGTFQDRTTVDLKDKWRNICKTIMKFNPSDQ